MLPSHKQKSPERHVEYAGTRHGGEHLVALHSPTCPGAILPPTELSHTGATATEWGRRTQPPPSHPAS